MLSARNCEPEGASMSLESITQQIRKEISKLNQVLHLLEDGAKKTTRVRRKMSAAGRKRIAAAQKKRWAKIRAGKK
jgi:exonuclease VII small subunit